LNSINFKNLSSKFHFNNMEFNLKDEFNLTIIGNKTGKKIINILLYK
jgi:hypothetical protein